jgi:hypothetical protein
MIQYPEQYIVTAGGKIRCRRCKAQSSRTKLQCAKPALKGKSVCGNHGGYSTGPRSNEGKERIRSAHWKHGRETLEAKAKRSAGLTRLRKIEDVMVESGLFKIQRSKGRKPNGH